MLIVLVFLVYLGERDYDVGLREVIQLKKRDKLV